MSVTEVIRRQSSNSFLRVDAAVLCFPQILLLPDAGSTMTGEKEFISTGLILRQISKTIRPAMCQLELKVT